MTGVEKVDNHAWSLVLAVFGAMVGGNLVDKRGIPLKVIGALFLAISIFNLRVSLAPLGLVGVSIAIAAPVAAVGFGALIYLHGSRTGGDSVTSG